MEQKGRNVLSQVKTNENGLKEEDIKRGNGKGWGLPSS